MNETKFNLRFGIWITFTGILLALAYLAAMMATAVSSYGFPPVEPYGMFISIISLFSGIVILTLFAVLHACAPENRKLLSLIGFAFAILFAGLTSINRFTHLAIVRPGVYLGTTGGIEWFTPYGAYSIMTGMESRLGLFLRPGFCFPLPGIYRRKARTVTFSDLVCKRNTVSRLCPGFAYGHLLADICGCHSLGSGIYLFMHPVDYLL